MDNSSRKFSGSDLDQIVLERVRQRRIDTSAVMLEPELVKELERDLKGHPFFEAFGLEFCDRVSQIEALKEQIHEYQITHNVSGLRWRKIDWHGKRVVSPTNHPFLILLPRDSDVLRQWKDRVTDMWLKAADGFRVWRYDYTATGYPWVKSNIGAVVTAAQFSEWAEVTTYKEDLPDLSLTLGTGSLNQSSFSKHPCFSVSEHPCGPSW